MNPLNNSKTGAVRWPVWAALIILLALIGIGGSTLQGGVKKGGGSSANQPVFEAQRGPLTISVVESGTIRAREQLVIKSEVEGHPVILFLIPEGTTVKKGDLLVELDGSGLQDNLIDQEIRVQNAEATYIGSRENLAVVESQAQSDIDQATLDLDFAKQDLKKYVEGEYPKLIKELEAKIKLSEEELSRAQEDYKWSQILYDEKYISQTELKADELASNKADLDLQLAQADLALLEDYTNKRELAELESDVKQAEMALDRTERRAKSDVVQAEADLLAKVSEFEREEDKLQKLKEQIKKTKIFAPQPGLVVYATSSKRGGWHGSDEPLAEGQDVRERQELIHLPTTSSYMAEVKIHESSLEKIRIGLPVRITIDTSEKSFTGRVAKIAPLPDATSIFMNPDLKVYDTDIHIDGDGDELRNGLTCEVEIVAAQYEDAIYVPVQAVVRVGDVPTVYVADAGDFMPREIELGMDNNSMAHIISGLSENEEVLLTPPLAAATASKPNELDFLGEIPPPEEGASSGRPQGMGPPSGGRGPGGFGGGGRDRSSGGWGGPGGGSEGVVGGAGQGGGSGDWQNMTQEQKDEMKKKYQSMSPEERDKMREGRQSGGGSPAGPSGGGR